MTCSLAHVSTHDEPNTAAAFTSQVAGKKIATVFDMVTEPEDWSKGP